MPTLFNPQNKHRLDDENRRKLIPPAQVLQYMNMVPEDTILDIGTGIGYFAIPALEMLNNKGKLIAADISDVMLNELKSRSPQNRSLGKLEILLCPADFIPLPDAVADKILMAFVLHETVDKIKYLKEVKRLLKPGGLVTIVEWEKSESPFGPPMADRISKGEVKEFADRAGLQVIECVALNEYQYLCNIGRHQ